jgi:hypothetical protein
MRSAPGPRGFSERRATPPDAEPARIQQERTRIAPRREAAAIRLFETRVARSAAKGDPSTGSRPTNATRGSPTDLGTTLAARHRWWRRPWRESVPSEPSPKSARRGAPRTAMCGDRAPRSVRGPFKTRRWRYNETRDRGDSDLRAVRSREEVRGDVGCRSCRRRFRALVDGRIDCRCIDGMFEGRTGVQCKGSTGGTFDGLTDSQRICNRRGAASPEAAPLVFSACFSSRATPRDSPRKKWPQKSKDDPKGAADVRRSSLPLDIRNCAIRPPGS